MYKIDSVETVQFLPGYDHLAFTGHEKDASLQALILKAFAGELESDERWVSFVDEKHA
jgi:hypothetical protein